MKKIVTLLLFSLYFTSCDKSVGGSGVVQDAVTGKRLRDVVVKMTSEQGGKTALTDKNGFFNVAKSFSCGISNCDDSFTIEFTKADYDTVRISRGDYSSEVSEFVNNEKRDTLLITLYLKN